MSICVVLCVIVRCWTGDRHENERDAHISTAHGHQLHARPHACPRKNVDKCTWVRLTVAASEHELRENIQWVPVRFARQSVRPASSQVRMYMQCPLTDRACMSGREDGRRSGRRFIERVRPRARGLAQNRSLHLRRSATTIWWRHGGAWWRLARAAPTRTPWRDRGRQHVPLPCAVAGLLMISATPHTPLGMQCNAPRRRIFWPKQGDGCGRRGRLSPARRPGPVAPRRAEASRADTRGRWRPSDRGPDRHRSWHDTGRDVHAAYRHVSDFVSLLLARWVRTRNT